MNKILLKMFNPYENHIHGDGDNNFGICFILFTQVELATGEFPYKNCKTDFEVLTKVLQEDPPLLPTDQAFSPEFCSFVKDW